MADNCVMGSRIKLISKAQIRYEGLLSKVDPNANTVTLDNVSMFGTEGRAAGTGPEIPPSDSVYPQIVFKGSDISHLMVISGHQSSSIPDPAVLSMREPSSKTQMTMPSMSMQSQRGYGGDRYNNFNSNMGGKGFSLDGKRGADPWSNAGQKSTVYDRNQSFYDGGKGFSDHYGGGMSDRFQSNMGMGKGSKRGYGHHAVHRSGGGGGGGKRGFGKGARGGTKSRDSGHTGRDFKSISEDVAKNNRTKLGQDFNFDDIAATSAKISLEKTATEEEPKPSYNKSQSFFDNLTAGGDGQRLSQKERQRHHEEDVATFGREAVVGVERSFHSRSRRGNARGRW